VSVAQQADLSREETARPVATGYSFSYTPAVLPGAGMTHSPAHGTIRHVITMDSFHSSDPFPPWEQICLHCYVVRRNGNYFAWDRSRRDCLLLEEALLWFREREREREQERWSHLQIIIYNGEDWGYSSSFFFKYFFRKLYFCSSRITIFNFLFRANSPDFTTGRRTGDSDRGRARTGTSAGRDCDNRQGLR